MDQQLNAAVALQADGVFSLKQGGHFARERGNHLAHRRDNGDPFTQQAAGEGAIRHLLEGDNAAAHRRQNIVCRGRGYRHGARCSAGARQAGEEGQHAGEHESHAGADKPAPDAGVNPAGRDHLRREKDVWQAKRVGITVAKGSDRPANRPGDTAEDKRTAQRQSQAIDSRLGDAEQPGGEGGTGQHPLTRIAGGEENTEHGAHLGNHRRKNNRQHGVVTKYRHVVDHQRHQTPVQAENNAHLPHGAQYRARQPWGKRINELVAVGQQMAQPGGDRANHQEGERDHHRQADRRAEEVFHR